jgi:hypothetical protein
MPIHTLTSKIARALHDVDAARARAGTSHASFAMLARATSRAPEGKALPAAQPAKRGEKAALPV